MSHRSHDKVFILGFAAALAVAPVLACGPFFPNQLLFNSGESVTWAPVADFHHEIAGIIPLQTDVHAMPPDEASGAFEQSAAADVADLHDALITAKTPADQQAELLGRYWALRGCLTQHAKAGAEPHDPNKKPDPLPDLKIPVGLPAEFEGYIRGAIHYENGRKADARAAWEAVLQLPADQRKYRSVWAQFMIGKSYLTTDAPKAIAAFQAVRERVKQGARDSLGLAAASLGWEARAELDQKHYGRAIELYELHAASGDPTAVRSLAIACDRCFDDKDPAILPSLAGNPIAARILTAYVLAGGEPIESPLVEDKAKVWLSSLEKSPTTSVIGADRLGWAEYQAGNMTAARRWIDKADEKAPMALWVRAKLLSREGKIDAAAKVLAQAVHAFPADETWDGVAGTYEPEEDYGYSGPTLFPAKRISAELGVLELARGQYVESLDRLLKADWWLDAAYVAERVLTEDELVTYVDRHCPEGTHPELRHLLARRLTRDGHWKEARPYFPVKLQDTLDTYIGAIRDGHNEKLATDARARAFWNAAQIARHQGMDLMGTELAPDDFPNDGAYDGSDVPKERQNSKDALLPPTADEIQRIAASGPKPDKRWHYRYIAADHAWSAAELMPDESAQLAMVLTEAGSWLSAKDPKTALRFYKALVTRCGTTSLGRAAREKKWFPPAPHGL